MKREHGMPLKNETPATCVETAAAFARWLRRNHRTATELWVGYYKRATGRPSESCVA